MPSEDMIVNPLGFLPHVQSHKPLRVKVPSFSVCGRFAQSQMFRIALEEEDFCKSVVEVTCSRSHHRVSPPAPLRDLNRRCVSVDDLSRDYKCIVVQPVQKTPNMGPSPTSQNEDPNAPNIPTENWNHHRGWINVLDGKKSHVEYTDSCRHNGQIVPVTLATTVESLCKQHCWKELYLELNRTLVNKLKPRDRPLDIQRRFLWSLGYRNEPRILSEGAEPSSAHLCRFHTRCPSKKSGQLSPQGTLCILKGMIFPHWTRKFCQIVGNQLEVQLGGSTAKVDLNQASVHRVKMRGANYCLKIINPKYKNLLLSFTSEHEQDEWERFLLHGCQKSSSSIDLSGQNLTEIPEAVFQSSQLSSLNLRHNLFQNVNSPASPLSDLLKLKHLRIVNLSSNGLEEFPCVLCHLETLVEVNLSCNKITHVPDDVSQLTKLEQLELHSNQISILPDSLENCVALKKLNLGFNSFSRVPDVLSKMKLLDQIALPGNTLNNLECYECSHPENKVITKADFCRNSISGDVFLGQCSAYKHLTELDISDNNIRCLDVSELIHLKSLKCVNNQIHDLRVNGQSLKLLIAAKNELDSITIHPVPETLQSLDLSRNHISSVPSWICDLVYLKHLDLSYNDLQELYPNILLNPSICILYVNNNRLKLIGEINQQSSLEMLFAQNNMIVELPVDFFQKAKDLRVLNMTNNRLTSLPAPNLKETHVQEMYLSANYLSDAALSGMSRMVRLRCLHLAHNDIHILPESLIINLVELEELNVSGNRLTRIPNALTTLSNLVICKLHSNNIRQLPNFLPLTKLKDLDVSCNGLKNINLSTLLPPTLQALDISNNPQLPVNPKDVRKSSGRNVKLVDTTCGRRSMSRSLDDLLSCDDHLWTLGFSETSGQRNKLCVSQLRLPHYSSDPDGSNASQECLLGMFDGGLNNELPHIMTEILPQIVLKERTCTETSSDYLRYAILTIHRELENLGRKLGASALVCHISKRQKEDLIPSCNTPGHTHMGVPEYVLRVANVGNMQAVVCQKGVAKVLTRNFSVDKDSAENQRLRDLHTIVTGNGLVCGISSTTRLIGSTYLYPTLIPNPHVTETILHDDDEFLVVANHRLWEVMSPEEVVKEVQLTCNPTAAAKRLQDLAQGYGVQENLSIIVLRLHLVSDPKGQIAAWVHRHSRDAKPWASKFANDISQTLTFQEFKNDPHQILKSINLRGESLSSLTSESNYPKSENNEQDFRTYEEEIRRSKILSKKVVDLGENYTHHLHDCYPTMGSEKTWSDDNNHDSAIDIDPLSSSEGHAHAHDSGSSDSGQNGHLADSEDTGSDISPLGKISDEQLRSWEYFLEENSKMLFEKELISLPAEKKRHFQLALSNKGLLPKGLLKTKLRNSMNELPLSPSSEMGTTEVKSYAPAEAMIHTLAHRYPEIQEQRSHIVEEMIPKKPRNTAVTHL